MPGAEDAEPEEGAVDGGPPPPSRPGSEPSPDVLAAFAAAGPPSPLSGGEGRQWRAADPVLTPCREPAQQAERRLVGRGGQVVSGALAENVLVPDGLPAAVIDVTPYWRPAGLSSAIVVGDAIRWRDADPAPLFEVLADIEAFPQLFLRAV